MKTPHVHAAMIKEWVEDTSRVVGYRESPNHLWYITANPSWVPDFEYRFRHKHQDLIDQKAAWPELIVEIKFRGQWEKLAKQYQDDPGWDEYHEYRLVEPRHKHQDLIDQKAARPELIVEVFAYGTWNAMSECTVWNEDCEYRLVESPKKKVKMWQWVAKYTNNIPFLTINFYTNESELVRQGMKVIQRADWTEIEVDE